MGVYTQGGYLPRYIGRCTPREAYQAYTQGGVHPGKHTRHIHLGYTPREAYLHIPPRIHPPREAYPVYTTLGIPTMVERYLQTHPGYTHHGREA